MKIYLKHKVDFFNIKGKSVKEVKKWVEEKGQLSQFELLLKTIDVEKEQFDYLGLEVTDENPLLGFIHQKEIDDGFYIEKEGYLHPVFEMDIIDTTNKSKLEIIKWASKYKDFDGSSIEYIDNCKDKYMVHSEEEGLGSISESMFHDNFVTDEDII